MLEAARAGDPWFLLHVMQAMTGGIDGSTPELQQIGSGWYFLMCRLNAQCDVAVARARLESEQYLYEIEAAEREADALWAMFEDGSIHEHDFRTPAWRP